MLDPLRPGKELPPVTNVVDSLLPPAAVNFSTTILPLPSALTVMIAPVVLDDGSIIRMPQLSPESDNALADAISTVVVISALPNDLEWRGASAPDALRFCHMGRDPDVKDPEERLASAQQVL